MTVAPAWPARPQSGVGSSVQHNGTPVATPNFVDVTLADLVALGVVPQTLVDAKGDLIAASAADTVVRVPVGTNGQVLTADSTQASGIKWATPATGGGGGVAKAYRSGRYYQSECAGAAFGTMQPVNGRLYAMPFRAVESVTLNEIDVEVTTLASAGGLIRLGLYADDGTGYPGALVGDYGTVDTTTNGAKPIAITQALSAGTLYWLACVEQGAPTTGVTVRGFAPTNPGNVLPIGEPAATTTQAHFGYQTGGNTVTGALPATYPAGIASVSNVPRVLVRAA